MSLLHTRKGSLIDRDNWDADECWYRKGNRVGWYDRRIRLWTCHNVTDNGQQLEDDAADLIYYGYADQLTLGEAQNGY